jgi:hypothetical protein
VITGQKARVGTRFHYPWTRLFHRLLVGDCKQRPCYGCGPTLGAWGSPVWPFAARWSVALAADFSRSRIALMKVARPNPRPTRATKGASSSITQNHTPLAPRAADSFIGGGRDCALR